MKKFHDEAVEKIVKEPGILGIEGLRSEKLLYPPIKFPQLKKEGQETGDIILIWSSLPGEWEILVAEVKIGARRHPGKDFLKLKFTFNYLKNCWRKWFESIKLNLPEGYTLWIRTVSLSYAGKALWEQPFKSEKRIRIF
ncbi:hypothetical protein COX73_00135 [bacterium (Candidatus Gribaldobacteria) CG_4_10_14_0_2_um_filter_36_18]|uniref:DUF234 domain-containing protein n=1 Tax=bacterium (Candidatus Gribaldobacteria) CG_4_10_14_0_2_um_filter_36_18 TaxID=2014264 RepID=A0A2M7VL87_9BACT|nr:MAG: hypothetical protein COX73_00135 [bacterium (Candidatus Gribaldobacteria) CG_4_10_14_0_2_um_filter_36_18]